MTEPTSNRPAGGPDPSEGESPAGGGPQATSETDAARGDAPATPERSPGPKGPDAEASAAEAGPPVRPRPAPDSTAAARGARRLGMVALGILACAALLWIGLLIGQAKGRREASGSAPAAAKAEEPTVWTCSMHPQIQLPEFGACPICGMDLIPLVSGGDDRGPREVRLSPAAAALAEIETAPVRRRGVDREVRLVGLVDYDETRLNHITAWVPGRLDRLYVDYTGTRVQKGDHLVGIYSPELLVAQQELIQAIEANAALRASGSKLLRETADQTIGSAREKLRLWGLGADQIAEIERTRATSEQVTIRAPIGGVVVQKNKNLGDYVKTGERIYTIADLSQVWVKLDAYESDLTWIRYGQTVAFEAEAYPGVTFEGRVVFIDPVVTPKTRTVKVRINVANDDGRLKPGMFVRATVSAPLEAEGQTMDPSLAGKWICPMHWEVIHDGPGACDECGMPLVKAETLHGGDGGAGEPPLVVPASAVLWTGVRSLVYVRLPGDEPAFEGRQVVLGPRAGAFYVIRSGLEVGEQVVVRGSFKLDSALQIEAKPSMMLPPEEEAEPQAHDVSAAFRRALDPVYDAYLAGQEALAGDDAGAAAAAFARLEAAARAVDMKLVHGEAHRAWMALARRLRDGAAAVAEAQGLAAMRAAFADLSEAVIELERQFGHRSGALREAFCPMARDNQGASWLQRGAEIRNPFFGSQMLTCGEVRATFEPRGPAGAEAGTEPPVRPVEEPPAEPPPPAESAEGPAPGKAPAEGRDRPLPDAVWTCPMHPEVQAGGPGKCPKCGMALVRQQEEAPAKAVWTCPMHPEVQAGGPGKCPKCGMALTRQEGER